MGLVWNAAKLVPGVKKKVAGKLNGLGMRVAERARELAPVDSGYLRSTIGYTMNTDELRVRIHADASYAIFVEYGSSRNPAQPYLRPALAEAAGFWGSVSTTEMQFTNTPTPYYTTTRPPETAGVKTVVRRDDGRERGRAGEGEGATRRARGKGRLGTVGG